MRNKDKINTRPLPHLPMPSVQAEIHSFIPNPSAPSPGARGDSCGQAIIVPCSNVGLLPGGMPSGQNCFSEHPTQATDPARTACCGAGLHGPQFSSQNGCLPHHSPLQGLQANTCFPMLPLHRPQGNFCSYSPLLLLFFPHTSVPCGILNISPFLKRAFCEAPPAGMRGCVLQWSRPEPSTSSSSQSRPRHGAQHTLPAGAPATICCSRSGSRHRSRVEIE